MKAYVASRTAEKKIAAKVGRRLEKHGFTVSYDWTAQMQFMDYEAHRDASADAAERMRQGCIEANLFVLLWNEELYGALIKLGMVLGRSVRRRPASGYSSAQKRIYIIGTKKRVCIFEMMEEFRVVETINELFKAIESDELLRSIKMLELLTSVDSDEPPPGLSRRQQRQWKKEREEYLDAQKSVVDARRSAVRNEGNIHIY